MNHLALDRLTGYNFQIPISAHWSGNIRLGASLFPLGIKENVEGEKYLIATNI